MIPLSPRRSRGNIAAGAPYGNRSTATATGACPGKTMRQLKEAGAMDLKFHQFWGKLVFKSKPARIMSCSVPLIPKFASEVPRTLANFGIGTLASLG
jgi:hypothetical protein